MSKLYNFPSVNIITIPECSIRVNLLVKQFNLFNIDNIKINLFKKYESGDHVFEGKYVHLMPEAYKGIVSSHLKCIKNWYNTTNEDYTVFCEDDLSLETVLYWSFDWLEFFNALPKNWGCVQMVILKDYSFLDHHLTFRRRNWDDWSACCYLMKRSFAKKIVDLYHRNYNVFTLNYRGLDEHKREISNNPFWLRPHSENVVYSLVEPVYTVPLFLENINFNTTTNMYESPENYIHQGLGHVNSHHQVLNWWKNGGLNINDVKNCSDIFE